MNHGDIHTQAQVMLSQFVTEQMLEHALKPLRLLSTELEDLLREQHQETLIMLKMHQSVMSIQEQKLLKKVSLKSVSHRVFHTLELVMLFQFAMELMLVTALKLLRLLNTESEDLSREQLLEIPTMLKILKQLHLKVNMLLSKCHGELLIKEQVTLSQSATEETMDTVSKHQKLLNID